MYNNIIKNIKHKTVTLYDMGGSFMFFSLFNVPYKINVNL